MTIVGNKALQFEAALNGHLERLSKRVAIIKAACLGIKFLEQFAPVVSFERGNVTDFEVTGVVTITWTSAIYHKLEGGDQPQLSEPSHEVKLQFRARIPTETKHAGPYRSEDESRLTPLFGAVVEAFRDVGTEVQISSFPEEHDVLEIILARNEGAIAFLYYLLPKIKE